jgi:hypothetical protein
MARLSVQELSDLKTVRKRLDYHLFSPSADDRVGDSEEVKKFIDEHTRLWRQSWVLPTIDKIIASAEEDLKKRRKRRST